MANLSLTLYITLILKNLIVHSMHIAISEISCTLPHPSLISNNYHKRRDQVKYVRSVSWYGDTCHAFGAWFSGIVERVKYATVRENHHFQESLSLITLYLAVLHVFFCLDAAYWNQARL